MLTQVQNEKDLHVICMTTSFGLPHKMFMMISNILEQSFDQFELLNINKLQNRNCSSFFKLLIFASWNWPFRELQWFIQRHENAMLLSIWHDTHDSIKSEYNERHDIVISTHIYIHSSKTEHQEIWRWRLHSQKQHLKYSSRQE